MATGNKNNKSSLRGIRFPHELIQEIETAVKLENQGSDKPVTNFSAWVLGACRDKLDNPNSDK
ncbi:YlcI/YnfO family protein [Actinobacillus equuli subsp. haemolyticus]|uniref:YlcI/YnfO family protein n=1 Tax=Actinobacillus equuli TaxID=718 RepID=UPI00244249B5|nr:YlcI/YnfO family protein [Actinobacillus equuli]WGE63706.1 YlcI/YnfO family protein [Actinobacillus equuli subsp. haemolyticus]